MRPDGDRFDDVVARIYDAALDPSAWQVALERASDLIGARGAMLFVADWTSGAYEPRVLARHRMDPEMLKVWQASYLAHDLWSHAMRALPPDFVATGASVVEPGTLRRSPIYLDVLRKLGVEDALSASLARTDRMEVPLSFYAAQLFQRPQITLFGQLAPHLRRAVRLQLQIDELDHRARVMEDVVAHMPLGIMTLARSGRIVWANRRAEDILRQRDGLTVHHERLGGARADETARIEAAIGAAAGGRGGDTVSVSRPSGRRPLAVIVAPVRRRADRAALGPDSSGHAAVVVTLCDPEAQPEVLPERLRRTFGLTLAEARLASALVRDRTVGEYAEEAGITINTARWTLKQVLAKTGCRRQSELVRLIVTMATAVG